MSLKIWDLLRANRQRALLIAVVCALFTSLLVLVPRASTAEGLFAGMKSVKTTSVSVEVDGIKLEVLSSANDVEGVINELGLFVGLDDMVVPNMKTPLADVESIAVLRVTKEFVVEKKNLEIEIVYEDRTNLEIGKKIVLDPGQEGIIEETIEVRYVNGEEVERTVINQEILQEPKTRVVAMGVKDMTTKEGVTFSFTKFFDDAELTSYSAGFIHTGKNPGDYWYGMTFTGTEVKEGRTVAVDPKVIPLGWWIYIEGYGFRRAEDTGSAVRNKRVDIYFEDDDFVSKFGLKRNAKIWVIGPNDPRQ